LVDEVTYVKEIVKQIGYIKSKGKNVVRDRISVSEVQPGKVTVVEVNLPIEQKTKWFTARAKIVL
jgi:septum formation topological specificity factor MinE